VTLGALLLDPVLGRDQVEEALSRRRNGAIREGLARDVAGEAGAVAARERAQEPAVDVVVTDGLLRAPGDEVKRAHWRGARSLPALPLLARGRTRPDVMLVRTGRERPDRDIGGQ